MTSPLSAFPFPALLPCSPCSRTACSCPPLPEGSVPALHSHGDHLFLPSMPTGICSCPAGARGTSLSPRSPYSAVPKHCPQSVSAISCQIQAHPELSILCTPSSPPSGVLLHGLAVPTTAPELLLSPRTFPRSPSVPESYKTHLAVGPQSLLARDEPLPFSMPGAAPLLPSPDCRDKPQPEQRFLCVPSPCQSRAGQVWAGLLSPSLLLLPRTAACCGGRSGLPGREDVEPSFPRCLLACLQGRTISQQQLEVGFQAGDRWTLTKAGNGCNSPLEEE